MRSEDGISLGIVRGISFGVFGPPDVFMPAVRALGSRFARVYLTWNEIEPEAGKLDWTAVDALLSQIESGRRDLGDGRLRLAVGDIGSDPLPAGLTAQRPCSHTWFVAALVARCRGRIRYGSVTMNRATRVFGRVPRSSTRSLRRPSPPPCGAPTRMQTVVLGGCGYDVLAAPDDGQPRAFFNTVLARAAHRFRSLLRASLRRSGAEFLLPILRMSAG